MKEVLVPSSTLEKPKLAKVPKTYSDLLRQIRQTINQGKLRAQDAVEREKVRTSWEIGKHILDHVFLNQSRAGYGEQVTQKLSKDLGISQTELKYMVQFARTYPIRRPADQLSWSEYEALLAINDDTQRKQLIDQAIKEKWNRKDLRREIKKIKNIKQTSMALLEPLCGESGTYLISENSRGELFVDLGFSDYWKLPEAYQAKFKTGEIIELDLKTSSLVSCPFALKKSERSEDDLYTYTAEVLEVIDGDTLRAEISLGFGFTTVQKLRLRGIDAPELNTKEGEEAKKFVEKILRSKDAKKQEKSLPLASGFSASIIIATSKSDKYDRYLADVFLPARKGVILSGEGAKDLVFLNNELLKRGLASAVQG